MKCKIEKIYSSKEIASYEASIKLKDGTYIAAYGKTKSFAIDNLKDHIRFILLELSESKIKFKKMSNNKLINIINIQSVLINLLI